MSATETRPIRIAQVGVGYWGRNLLRTFAALPDADIVLACDHSADVLAHTEAAHPGLKTTARFEDLLESDEVEAVVVATETPQHFLMAESALRSGKHQASTSSSRSH